ncbi:D-tyrosyl-tRNA(Tyr) deacylase [Saccharomyces paradoxus]|uniref:D-aminoacyl-tRNA deacylase n=1 Tax=Saccharomyces paradoxus TaxID=27291 RepID=A0A8B8UMQ2_SACPA|nr:Dtd1 [Saccharomyces paradoxus]QHS72028.1 Dtd1 [Saccharomyces paradoxus]
MKIVLQKVSQASVVVDSKVISSIKHGYMLLVGISIDDSMAEVDKLSKKVLSLRIFEDETKNLWKRNIKEVNGEILSVSQFTLMAKTKKGTKPDFHLAQKGHIAKELYEEFLKLLKSDLGEDQVKDGEFGAMMSCSLTNEGPVTIILDSDQ